MKVSDYITNFFVEKGITHAFGITGGVIIHVFDSIEKHPDIKLISPGTEQGGAIMADSYARVTGKPGLVTVTSGPGVTNAITGLACSYYDSIPVIYISGQVSRGHLKQKLKEEHDIDVRQRGFQELDVPSLVGSLTKYVKVVKNEEDIRYELEKAYHLATSGRPGPVWLDIPEDIHWQDVNPELLRSYSPESKQIPVDLSEKIEKSIELIEKAKRPVIVVGNGVRLVNAYEETKDLIEKLNFPAAMTWATKDMFPEDYPLVIEGFGVSSERPGNFAIQNADLLIVLASRLDTHETGSRLSEFARGAEKIIIDIDENELNKYKPLGIVGEPILIKADVKDFLIEILKKEINPQNVTDWTEKIKEWKRKYPVTLPEYKNKKDFVDPYVFMDELSKQLEEEDILFTDAGANLTWTMQSFKIKKGQRLISAFNHSPMGYSLPACIGASFATKKPINCITGDGSISMNGQELGTARLHNLPVRIFVLNNKGYGIIRQTQDTWLEGRHTATNEEGGVYVPDIEKTAYSYNIPVLVVNNHDELEFSIRNALQYEDGPIVVDVRIDPEQKILPKLTFGRPIEDSAPLLSREEFKQNMIVPPLESSLEEEKEIIN